MKKIAIVGAGIAGLTAAHHLKKHGHNPTIFEANTWVGGRVNSIHHNQYVFENGAGFILESYKIINELISEFSLRDQIVPYPNQSAVYVDGKLHSLEPGNLLLSTFSGLLNPADLMRAFLFQIRQTFTSGRLPLYDYSCWQQYDLENAEKVCEERIGLNLTRLAIEPAMASMFCYPMIEMSYALSEMILSQFLKRTRFFTLRSGLQELPKRMAKGFDVRTGLMVKLVEKTKVGVTLKTDHESFDFDQVILALPSPIARRIYKPGTEIERKLLDVDYSPIVKSANLVEWNGTPLPYYGILFDKTERRFSSSFGCQKPQGQNQAISIDIDLIAHSKRFDESQENLAHLSGQALKQVSGETPKVLWNHIHKWEHAIAKVPVGQTKRVKEYREGFSSTGNPVALSGDYMNFVCIEGAAETGKWAAEQFLQN